MSEVYYKGLQKELQLDTHTLDKVMSVLRSSFTFGHAYTILILIRRRIPKIHTLKASLLVLLFRFSRFWTTCWTRTRISWPCSWRERELHQLRGKTTTASSSAASGTSWSTRLARRRREVDNVSTLRLDIKALRIYEIVGLPDCLGCVLCSTGCSFWKWLKRSIINQWNLS